MTRPVRGGILLLGLVACASSSPGPVTEVAPAPPPEESAMPLADSVPTALMIAGALSEAGDMMAALPYYRFAFEREPDSADIGERLANAALRAGQAREAAGVLAQVVERHPDRWDLAARRGRLLFLLNDPDGAEHVLADLLPDHAAEPEVVDLRVDLLVQRGDVDGAGAVLTRFVAAHPGDLDRRFRLATLRARGQDLPGAEVQLRAMLERVPDHPEALELLGALLRQEGRAEEWRQTVRELRERAPHSRALTLELADLYIAQGEPHRAADLLVPLAQSGELDWTDRLLLADLLGQIDRRAEAIALVEELMNDGWKGPLVLRLAGSLAMEEGDDAAAEQYLREAIKADPADADAMLTLLLVLTRQHGDLFTEAGLDVEAKPEVAKRISSLVNRAAESADPDRVRQQYLTGAILRRMGRDADAIPFLSRAVQLDPGNEQILYDLAVSQEQTGDFEAAVVTLESLLELQPDDAHYLNFFGYLLADQGWQLERAERLVQRALEQDPDNAFYQDSMGWVYFRTERYEEALDLLVSATNSLGNDPVVLEHMGDTLAALARYEQALRMYRLSLEMGGEAERLEPRLREVERLLRKGP